MPVTEISWRFATGMVKVALVIFWRGSHGMNVWTPEAVSRTSQHGAGVTSFGQGMVLAEIHPLWRRTNVFGDT